MKLMFNGKRQFLALVLLFAILAPVNRGSQLQGATGTWGKTGSVPGMFGESALLYP